MKDATKKPGHLPNGWSWEGRDHVDLEMTGFFFRKKENQYEIKASRAEQAPSIEKNRRFTGSNTTYLQSKDKWNLGKGTGLLGGGGEQVSDSWSYQDGPSLGWSHTVFND